MNTQKFLILLIFLLILLTGTAFTDLYKRAPDVLPGTTPEMRTTEYWGARMKNPDEVILTFDEIQEMNKAFQARMKSNGPFEDIEDTRKPDLKTVLRRPGRVLSIPDIDTMSPDEMADTVRKQIRGEITYLRSQPFGSVLAVEYAPWQIDNFEKEMAIDNLPNEIKVRYGITVCHTRLRIIPSHFPMEQGIVENQKTRWDLWNLDILRIARPVTVLHSSLSGAYLFVLSDKGYGWVRSENIAFAPEETIDRYINSRIFLVCTADRVLYYGDNRHSFVSGRLRMGDRIPAVEINGLKAVVVPARLPDGSLITSHAWIKKDSQLHDGYVPYTRRNIVETAFRLLDLNYDWTGAWYGRNHETTYRDMYRVFGFELPFHGMLFTMYGHTKTVVQPDMGIKEQKRTILTHEPFVTIQNCGGHCQVLLGGVNGEPIVFDQHGYGYQLEDKSWLEVRRCSIGDMRMPGYFLKNKITFLELKK